jgi:ferric-chelate reductase
MHPRPSPHTPLSLRFSVHWTRTSPRAPRVPRTALPPGMHLRPGRPDIHATMQSVILGVRDAYSMGRGRSHSHSAVSPSGIVIGSCGPIALIDDATRAVGRVSWADWKDVGGVESIEEYVLQNGFFYVHAPNKTLICTGYTGGDFLLV